MKILLCYGERNGRHVRRSVAGALTSGTEYATIPLAVEGGNKMRGGHVLRYAGPRTKMSCADKVCQGSAELTIESGAAGDTARWAVYASHRVADSSSG